MEIIVSAEPPHPALPSGRWQLHPDLLRRAVEEGLLTQDVRFSPDPAGDRIRVRLDPDVDCELPTAWLQVFLDQIADGTRRHCA
jgi:hypothetical protein